MIFGLARLQAAARSVLVRMDADGWIFRDLWRCGRWIQVDDNSCFPRTTWLQTRMVFLWPTMRCANKLTCRAEPAASHSFTVSQLQLKLSMTRHDAILSAAIAGWISFASRADAQVCEHKTQKIIILCTGSVVRPHTWNASTLRLAMKLTPPIADVSDGSK